MSKVFTLIALLLTSFHANSSIVLNSGESFSSSFNLVSDGERFKVTDLFWEVYAEIEVFAFTSGELTLTVFEDSSFTTEIFSSTNNLGSFAIDTINERKIGGANPFAFTDFDGSFIIENTGADPFGIHTITVANFAGSEIPSLAAFATITPAAVPLPAAGWLLISAIGLLGTFRRNR